MMQKTIENFLEGAMLKMPAVVCSKNELRFKREVYSDYTLLVFNLNKPMTITELFTELEGVHGLTLMYHHARSNQTDFGHSVSLFQEPGLGEMFQLDATTNSMGKVTQVTVKLYLSLERMVTELRQQLSRMGTMSGHFLYKMEDYELLTYFM